MQNQFEYFPMEYNSQQITYKHNDIIIQFQFSSSYFSIIHIHFVLDYPVTKGDSLKLSNKIENNFLRVKFQQHLAIKSVECVYCFNILLEN